MVNNIKDKIAKQNNAKVPAPTKTPVQLKLEQSRASRQKTAQATQKPVEQPGTQISSIPKEQPKTVDPRTVIKNQNQPKTVDPKQAIRQQNNAPQPTVDTVQPTTVQQKVNQAKPFDQGEIDAIKQQKQSFIQGGGTEEDFFKKLQSSPEFVERSRATGSQQTAQFKEELKGTVKEDIAQRNQENISEDTVLEGLMTGVDYGLETADAKNAQQRKTQLDNMASLSTEQIVSAVNSNRILPGSTALKDLQKFYPEKYEQVLQGVKDQQTLDDINSFESSMFDNLNKQTKRKGGEEGMYDEIYGRSDQTTGSTYFDSLTGTVFDKVQGQFGGDAQEYINFVQSALDTPEIQAQTEKVINIQAKKEELQRQINEIEEDIRKKSPSEAPEQFMTAYIGEATEDLRDQLETLNMDLNTEQSLLTSYVDTATNTINTYKEAKAIQAQQDAYEQNERKMEQDAVIAQQKAQADALQQQFTNALSLENLAVSKGKAEFERNKFYAEFGLDQMKEANSLSQKEQEQMMSLLKAEGTPSQMKQDIYDYMFNGIPMGGTPLPNVIPSNGGTGGSIPTDATSYIKSKEGFRENAYLDSAGVPTIGYGFTRIDGKPVQMGDFMDRGTADQELQKQMGQYQSFRDKVQTPLSPLQETALTSFEYNLGSGIWNTTGKDIIDAVNAGDFETAGNIMMLHNKARNPETGQLEVLRGLTTRRGEEAQMMMQAQNQSYDTADGLPPQAYVSDTPLVAEYDQELPYNPYRSSGGGDGELTETQQLLIAKLNKPLFGGNPSDKDTQRLEDILKAMGPEPDPAEVMRKFTFFDAGKETQLGEGLRDAIQSNMVVNDYDFVGLSDQLQRGNVGGAVNKVERSIEQQMKSNEGDNYVSKSKVESMVGQALDLEDYLEQNGGAGRGVSARDWTMNKLFNSDKFFNDTKTLETKVTNLVAKLRNEMIGASATETEIKMIAPLIPSKSDTVEVFMTKLQNLQEEPLRALNDIRQNYSLPTLDYNSLFSNDYLANQYRGEYQPEQVGYMADPLGTLGNRSNPHQSTENPFSLDI